MSGTLITPKYLKLSAEMNSLDYLEKAYHFIRQTEKHPIAWKWVVLALHGALYGFAICACKGTDPDRVTFKKKRREDRLIGFNEALNRCQDPTWMHMTAMSRTLQLSVEQRESIRKLKDLLRDKFEHYLPTIWLIEMHGFPQIAIDVLSVTRFLALDTGNHVHLTNAQMRKVRSVVFQSIRVLKQSKLYNTFELAKKGERMRGR